MSLLSRGSIHQGHEGFSGQSWRKQCSFMRLSALLTTQTIPVIEWSSTTIDNALVQGDNMYLNVFNNYLIFSGKAFLSLNNLPTVDKVVCHRQVCVCLCRQVYKAFALFYVAICAFPVVFLCFMLFYVDIDRSTGLMFHAFLCRQVLRLFMSTGLKFCAFLCRYLRFSMSTG